MKKGLPSPSSWLLVGSVHAQAGGDRVDFNRDIRPILAENCFYCHGQDASKRRRVSGSTNERPQLKSAIIAQRPGRQRTCQTYPLQRS